MGWTFLQATTPLGWYDSSRRAMRADSRTARGRGVDVTLHTARKNAITSAGSMQYLLCRVCGTAHEYYGVYVLHFTATHAKNPRCA